MFQYVLPSLYTLLLWGASTGLIIWLYRSRGPAAQAGFVGATVLLLVALWGLVATRDDTSSAGIYAAFTCGTLMWGWQLLAFYTGRITGPLRTACPADADLRQRFRHGLALLLHHELAALAAAALLLGLTWGAANQLGAATYVLLWAMHLCAKLNVFFGVRTFDDHLLPEHLHALRSLYVRRPMNAFFPPSFTIALIVTMVLFGRALAPEATPFEQTGCLMLAVMLVLGLAELAMLMLPSPAELWAGLRKALWPALGPALRRRTSRRRKPPLEREAESVIHAASADPHF